MSLQKEDTTFKRVESQASKRNYSKMGMVALNKKEDSMEINAVISDIMGVLLLKDPHWRKDVYWEKHLGLPRGTLFSALFEAETDQAAILGHISHREVFRRACQMLQLPPDALNGFEQALWEELIFNHELASFLQQLRPRYKTALLSNAWSNARHNIERLFQLHTFVDLQIFSAEEGLAKPDPRLYHLALSRLGVQPAEAIFIDDREENILAAQQIGMHTILFEDNKQAIAALQSMLTL
jgi:epoxide hydrolase-like predicted phosphatase